MPFFKLDEMPRSVISPGHSTAYGPTIAGKELEIGYTEPKGTGAKPHHHPSEQIILVLSGLQRKPGDIGPGEAALILDNQEHEQEALEDDTRFVSFETAAGSQPAGG